MAPGESDGKRDALDQPTRARLFARLASLGRPASTDELALPGGHIFHRDLSWPFAESDEEAGRWGVETAHPNLWLCGAGARRGGCVSGIPGHNAARAILEAQRLA